MLIGCKRDGTGWNGRCVNGRGYDVIRMKSVGKDLRVVPMYVIATGIGKMSFEDCRIS